MTGHVNVRYPIGVSRQGEYRQGQAGVPAKGCRKLSKAHRALACLGLCREGEGVERQGGGGVGEFVFLFSKWKKKMHC